MRPEHRDVAERGDQERLHVLLQERREDEQAPDAVDDARDAGEQLDRDADRAAEQHRAQFGQEHSDHQADRDRDQHRDEGSDERAVDRRERAEALGHRVPALVEEETRNRSVLIAGHAPMISATITPPRMHQHRKRGCARETAENDIAERRRSSTFARDCAPERSHSILQRDIDHGPPPIGRH